VPVDHIGDGGDQARPIASDESEHEGRHGLTVPTRRVGTQGLSRGSEVALGQHGGHPRDLDALALSEVRKHVDKAEKLAGKANGNAVAAQLDNAARKSVAPADSDLVQALGALAAANG